MVDDKIRSTYSIEDKYKNIFLYFTDGSSNKDSSGWAWYAPFEGIYYTQREDKKSNNYCELSALINLLEYIISNNKFYANGIVFIYTDSTYVKDSYNIWIDSWEKNNWIKTSDNKIVANKDLMIHLCSLKKELNNKYSNITIVISHVDSHEKNDNLLSFCNNVVDNFAQNKNKKIIINK